MSDLNNAVTKPIPPDPWQPRTLTSEEFMLILQAAAEEPEEEEEEEE